MKYTFIIQKSPFKDVLNGIEPIRHIDGGIYIDKTGSALVEIEIEANSKAEALDSLMQILCKKEND